MFEAAFVVSNVGSVLLFFVSGLVFWKMVVGVRWENVVFVANFSPVFDFSFRF